MGVFLTTDSEQTSRQSADLSTSVHLYGYGREDFEKTRF